MTVASKIRKRVNKIKPLELFDISDIQKDGETNSIVNRELSNLVSKKQLKRVRQGVYYVPKISKYGGLELSPSVEDIISYLTDKQTIGYVSGKNAHNILGLTSQVPNVVTIAIENVEKKRSGEFGKAKIKYVTAYGDITAKSIPLLQILDSFKTIKRISDTTVSKSLNRLKFLIGKLAYEDQLMLINQSMRYPPMVRAFVGLVLSNLWADSADSKHLSDLRESIISSTKFEFKSKLHFNKKTDWNIYDTAPKRR